MRYEVEGGRVVTWALEAHVVDHCNLRCEHCCTLSPQLGVRVARVEELAADLALAATVLRPHVFKLTGGEPLLHPDLVSCVRVVRESGIAAQVSVTTNGWLLPEVPDALFDGLDRMTLSVYSSAPLPEARIDEVGRRCREAGVVLTVKRIDRFGRMDRGAPAGDEETGRVFEECWLRARCHLVHAGRLYTCTRPPHLAQLGRAQGRGDLAQRDGVELAGDDRLGRVLRYLERDTPLDSCRLCLGASGGWAPHRQVAPGAGASQR